MSRFTESNFGFSFWYPTAWKVMNEPVGDPTEDGWFQNATIVKELQIINPADYYGGVTLLELLAPAGLTELGRSKSASPVGVDGRYFFDSGTHRWMYAQLSEAPDGAPPATHPAKISQRTMGGLPLFWGEARGGMEVIVALDGSHFLAIRTMDSADSNEIFLAATVVATSRGERQHTNEQQELDTVRREGVKYGAIGESLGGLWYKDSQHVYRFNGEVLRGADPKTFVPLPSNATGNYFATDGVHVYRAYSDNAIPGADPKTFVATSPFTAKDVHHTYDWTKGTLRIGSVTVRQ